MSTELLILQRRVGAVLRSLREQLNLSRPKAALKLLTSAESIKRYELGRIVHPEPMLMSSWARELGADEEVAEEISMLAYLSQGDKTRWGVEVPDQFGMLIEFERTASTLDVMCCDLLNGLIQIPEYHETTVCVSATLPVEKADDATAVQKKRAEKFFDKDTHTPQTRIVIPEEILLRIQREEYYEEQLQRLREIDARSEIQLFLLPLERGLHTSSTHAYKLMTFPHEQDPEIVYLDSAHDTYYDCSKEVTAVYRRMFDATLPEAVPFERSPYGRTSVA